MRTSELREALADAYLRLDRRVLGVFRIGLAGVLLYDLLRRAPDASLLWSSEGLLSSATLLKAPQASPQWSLLFAVTGGTEGAFALLGLVFLLYGLGLFTRWVQVLALLGYASLNARNLFCEDGGTATTILLLSWTLFLPLADRFSLDALRRDAAAPNLRARAEARRRAREPVTTLAAVCVLLQAAAIYWLNATHKNGITWRAGDAVHLVLWQHRVNTPFAWWLAAHEPAWFSPLASTATKRVELLMPLLLLWPTHLSFTRGTALSLSVLLHGGIALCLTLGPFSYAMICLVGLATPPELWNSVATRLASRGWGRRWARWRARVVVALSRRRRSERRMPELQGRRLGRWLREGALAYMLLVETASVLSSNPGVPAALRVQPGALLRGYKPYLRAHQSWSMFAPDAPREDGTLVVDAITRGGRHLDPFRGESTDFEQIRRGLSPHSIALSDYFFAMRDGRNRRYRRDLARFVRAQGDRADPYVSIEVWWVSYRPPPRGHYEPGPLEREKLWSASLKR